MASRRLRHAMPCHAQMHAELQVLSPLVPIREVVFLRFCKQHAEGLWAVVDVSVDAVLRPDQNGGGGSSSSSYMGCRLLPTGCIVQDMNNGYSKVINQTKSKQKLLHLSPVDCVCTCTHGAASMWRLQWWPGPRETPPLRPCTAQYFMLGESKAARAATTDAARQPMQRRQVPPSQCAPVRAHGGDDRRGRARARAEARVTTTAGFAGDDSATRRHSQQQPATAACLTLYCERARRTPR